jgi:hypothetical protein
MGGPQLYQLSGCFSDSSVAVAVTVAVQRLDKEPKRQPSGGQCGGGGCVVNGAWAWKTRCFGVCPLESQTKQAASELTGTLLALRRDKWKAKEGARNRAAGQREGKSGIKIPL